MKDVRKKPGKRRGRRSAFTLIELLVVVLILAVLTAIALPLYLQARLDGEKRVCQSNMESIANSVQAARVKFMKPDYGFAMGSVSTANEPDLQTLPVCPSGGTYTISDGGIGKANNTFKVLCTKHGAYSLGVPPP